MSRPPITAVREVLGPGSEPALAAAESAEGMSPPSHAAIQEPARLTETRQQLVSKDTSAMGRPQLIAEGAAAVKAMKEALVAANMIVMVKNNDALAAALAQDDGTSVEVAKQKLLGNGARGFTAEKSGIIYMKNLSQKEHDIIHETVHMTSAPGGTTKIKIEFGDPLNEGFTEYYTLQYCRELGVKEAKAYPLEVAFVSRLDDILGPTLLFDAYMKNAGMARIIEVLSRRWMERARGFEQDEGARAFVPPPTEAERAALLADRLKDGAFLNADAAFWNALLQ